jgi:hypothetical protein
LWGKFPTILVGIKNSIIFVLNKHNIMGTRSLTTFIDTYEKKDGKQGKTKIVTMYRQFDGYPDGHGMELADFLNKGKMVNGIGLDETELVYNGMGCLAAQAIAHFKDGPGNFYLYRGGTINCWEEYRYEVINNGVRNPLILRCYDVYKKKWIFSGTPAEFIEKFSFKKTTK